MTFVKNPYPPSFPFFSFALLPPGLRYFAPLHLAGLAQRLHVPFAGCRPSVLVSLLRRLFADVEETARSSSGGESGSKSGTRDRCEGGRSSVPGANERLPELTVAVCGGLVKVVFDSELLPGACVLEWNATPAADLVRSPMAGGLFVCCL
jgi:hypothetical protein